MTNPLRSPWLGWLVAVLLGGLWWAAPHNDVAFTAANAPSETKGAARTDCATEAIAPDPWSKQVALLTECRTKIREVRDTRAVCACDADGQPRNRATVEGTAGPEPRSDDRASDGSADAGTSVKSERHALKAVLGVTDKEADWLATYLCAVDDLRSATLDDLRAAGAVSYTHLTLPTTPYV